MATTTTAKPETALILSPTAAQNMMDKLQTEIVTLAPKTESDWTFEAFRLSVLAALNNERALKCTQLSLRRAVTECARYGFMPNTDEGLCFLIPYFEKDHFELHFQLGYPGIVTLLARMGIITEAWGIHANDIFEYRITTDKTILNFSPLLCMKEEERGSLIGAFAKFTLADGRSIIHAIDRAYIQKIVEAIKVKNRGQLSLPWQNHFVEMAKKTAIIHASKYLPRLDGPAAKAFFSAVREDSRPLFEQTSKQIDSDDYDDAVIVDSQQANGRPPTTKASRLAEKMKPANGNGNEPGTAKEQQGEAETNWNEAFNRLLAEHPDVPQAKRKEVIAAATENGKVNWKLAVEKLQAAIDDDDKNASDDAERRLIAIRDTIAEWARLFKEKGIAAFPAGFKTQFGFDLASIPDDKVDAALEYCFKIAKQFNVG